MVKMDAYCRTVVKMRDSKEQPVGSEDTLCH